MNTNHLTEKQIRNQEIDQVFYYYDEPKLYSCWIDNHRYLVFWVDEDDTKQVWYYIPISNNRYSEVIEATISLYSAFKHPENESLFKITITSTGQYAVTNVPSAQIDDALLPDKNCYLQPIEGKAHPHG